MREIAANGSSDPGGASTIYTQVQRFSIENILMSYGAPDILTEMILNALTWNILVVKKFQFVSFGEYAFERCCS